MNTNRIAPVVGTALAALMLANCAMDMGEHHHREFAAGGVDYAGYYDNAYGPIADGYWGGDGSFYYTDAAGHPFRRDDAHHFRKDAASGYQPIHGHHNGSTDEGHQ